MLVGGGKLFCSSEGRYIAAGHFGLLALNDEAAQKFSCHFDDQGNPVKNFM